MSLPAPVVKTLPSTSTLHTFPPNVQRAHNYQIARIRNNKHCYTFRLLSSAVSAPNFTQIR